MAIDLNRDEQVPNETNKSGYSSFIVRSFRPLPPSRWKLLNDISLEEGNTVLISAINMPLLSCRESVG